MDSGPMDHPRVCFRDEAMTARSVIPTKKFRVEQLGIEQKIDSSDLPPLLSICLAIKEAQMRVVNPSQTF
ncbi:MAG: hypothetical protein AAF202_10760, partial [Pseudomonadota bacterium]